LFVSESEDPTQVTLHEKRMDECSAKHSVSHLISNQSPAVDFLECVGVDPKRVGATGLGVLKADRWHPVGDLCCPENGEPVESQSVINVSSLLHGDRSWSQDFELQPVGSYRLQLKRI
jgi:hypothetical protein